jgi:hypothetical protein
VAEATEQSLLLHDDVPQPHDFVPQTHFVSPDANLRSQTTV